MKFVIIGVTALMLASCASVNSVDEVRVIALNAEATAMRAEKKANVAIEHAKATDAKLDNMFKKSMYK
jgi:hypothetical protein